MSDQYGFYVDTSRCIKCWACQVACKQWNGIAAGTTARRTVIEMDNGEYPDVTRTFISTACNHCEDPACVEICPVGAITKRDEDGAVVMNKSLCIGCQSCSIACPYGIPEYSPEDGLMDKCDMCVGCGRTAEGLPHCVATCPTKALKWGPLDEMEALALEKGGSRVIGPTQPAVFMS